MSDAATPDPIAALAEQWRRELPDLDTEAMVLIARLNRVRSLVMQRVETALADAGSSLAEFDVLSTLRRQGSPYRMNPSGIARSVMLSASGMTNRIDHLERAGLVRRVPDPTNRRVVPVELTERGADEAERLARLVVTVEEQILSNFGSDERSTLGALLAEFDAVVAEPE